jgi:hypothetical protein
MTIKEALTIKTKNLGVTPEDLDLFLIEAGLNGPDTYDPESHEQKVDMVWAGLLLSVIRVVEVREDDVSIKYSTDMKGIYSWLMRKWGLPDPFLPVLLKPTVRQVKFW